MADPRWTRLDSVRDKVVPLLANALDGGAFLDRLLTRGCISYPQQEKLRRRKREEALEEVARDLLSVLRLRPPPSFDTFCDVLQQGNDGNLLEIYDCITSTRIRVAEDDHSPERSRIELRAARESHRRLITNPQRSPIDQGPHAARKQLLSKS